MNDMGEVHYKKVVAHLEDGSLVKGYLESSLVSVSTTILQGADQAMPEEIALRPPSPGAEDSSHAKKISLRQAKALFFVEHFDGTDYREVKFFSSTPKADGLWARVTFRDNETIEGIVHNSLSFIADLGFFMKPPDPNSNNKMIYAVKSFMQDFRILGVQNEY